MSASPTEKFSFPRTSRLIRTADFGVILRTRNERSFRVHSACLNASCLENEEAGRIRVGVTVGKHNAPLSVDRAIVKRALREAARLRLPELRALLEADGLGMDVSLRLKNGLRSIEAASRTALKQALHADARALMDALLERARRRAAARRAQKS